ARARRRQATQSEKGWTPWQRSVQDDSSAVHGETGRLRIWHSVSEWRGAVQEKPSVANITLLIGPVCPLSANRLPATWFLSNRQPSGTWTGLEDQRTVGGRSLPDLPDHSVPRLSEHRDHVLQALSVK